MNYLKRVKNTLKSLELHAAEHDTSETRLPLKWIKACERPFPLSEGNSAEEAIGMFQVEQDLKGRAVTAKKDTLADTYILRIEKKPTSYEDPARTH